MNPQTILITGANSGIGKATAIELAQQGHHIIMVCRSPKRGETARQDIIKATNNENIDLELCDFASQASIRDCGLALREKYEKIDILINNAGAIFGERQVTQDGLEMTFGVNHIGYFLLTHYLLDLVKKGEAKRIVNVASLAHTFVRGDVDWDNLQGEKKYTQFGAYGLSKLCNIYFTNYLAKQLQNEGSDITVNSLHPGTIGTGFGNSGSKFFSWLVKIGRPFLASPNKGARTSVYLATSPKVEGVTGKYFSHCKETKISKVAQNAHNAKHLWRLSMDICNLKEYGNL